MISNAAPSIPSRIKTRASDSNFSQSLLPPCLAEESLPFTVKVVRTPGDLEKAVHIRHTAYSRHVPEFAVSLRNPELMDVASGFTVLLAESKLDGSALGTVRIQTNDFEPLALEQSVVLPGWLRGKRLAEAARLGVIEGKEGRLVTTVLFKSFYLFCLEEGIDWMVVVGRPSMARQHERLLFENVFPGAGFIPMQHVNNIPHQISASNVADAEERWAKANHPLFDFAFRTRHPDIEIPDSTTRKEASLFGEPRKGTGNHFQFGHPRKISEAGELLA